MMCTEDSVKSNVQGVLSYRCFGLHGFGCTRLRKIIAKCLKTCSIHNAKFSYTRFSGTLKRELSDLHHLSQLYTISGRAQAKFTFYTILGLHGAFMNVTPHTTENSLYLSQEIAITALV